MDADDSAPPRPSPTAMARRERHLVTAQWGDQMHKMFSIQFTRDGSIFLHFPYGPDGSGHVSRAVAQAGATEVDFSEHARVTTHKVKYSHHPDGRCHFSQDGKVRTEVRNQSFSLTSDPGHIFSFDAQGFTTFDVLKAGDATKYSIINFRVREPKEPECLHFIGSWWRIPARQTPETLVNPTVIRNDPENRLFLGALPPGHFPSSTHVLLVAARATPRLNDQPVLLNFVGGFGHNFSDPHKDSSFLVLGYPSLDPTRFPTLDYTPPPAN